MRLLALLLVFPFILQAQTIVLNTSGVLPAALSESSGLALSDAGGYWTHNDSGDQPLLYQIDAAGNIIRTLKIYNADNIDWEDLTRDSNGRMYIGDFGNNDHNRTDLKIYRIPNPDLIIADSVEAALIEFNLPDQTLFPPPISQQNFDIEAMIHVGGSLYLFSKNWTSPFTGTSKIYRVPQSPGAYTAQLIDSLNTGPGPAFNDWITAADVSPDGQSLALLSYDALYLYSCRNQRNFLDAPLQVIPFSGILSQKEGIVFTSNTEIAITDEELFIFPATLYTADISAFIPNNCCKAPQLLSPVASFPGEALITWDNTIGADAYRVFLKELGGPVQTQIVSDPIVFFTGLDSTADYRAIVQAKCGNQISANSDTIAVVPGSPKLVPLSPQIYPNPAVDFIQITGYQGAWRLFNSSGTLVAIGNEALIDIEKHPTGVYLIELSASKTYQILMIR